MSIRVDAVDRVYAWLEGQGADWVALREDPRDVDLLVADDALPALFDAFARRRGRGARKMDLYGVRGEHGSAYHGFPHLPAPLAERALARRRRDSSGVWRPDPGDALLALAYHLVYHKAEQSGLDWADPRSGAARPAGVTLRTLADAAGCRLEPTLRGLHDLLVDAGFGVSPERLAAYVRHDFRQGRKVWFHARLFDQLPGEMNLFVIREVAARHGRVAELLERLAGTYRVVTSKPIPWLTRWRTRRQMRGGKWRRGGRPCVAVVVYDPSPVPTTPADRLVHPHVFNSRQFVKQAWREQFIASTGASPKDNPIHSTDNEAEAIGHLPLFFTEAEQADIVARVSTLRGGDALRFGRDPGDQA